MRTGTEQKDEDMMLPLGPAGLCLVGANSRTSSSQTQAHHRQLAWAEERCGILRTLSGAGEIGMPHLIGIESVQGCSWQALCADG